MKSSLSPPVFPPPSRPSSKTASCPFFSTTIPSRSTPASTNWRPPSPRQNQSRHDGPHPRQPVRPRRRRRSFARNTTSGSSKTTATPSAAPTTAKAHRHLRRSFHPIVLSAAPSHPGRGRRRQYCQQHEAQSPRRELPRLGPRLLVRQRHGQHLRQTFRLATGRTARGLRPQIHLLATSATT